MRIIMINLSYLSDEVRDFHPIIKTCLNNALKEAGLDELYSIEHHYGVHTSGIPDFVVLDKSTHDYVCVIEVKKTPTSVFYFGHLGQAKSYVDDLHPLRWKSGFFPYFCVTNIEFTQFLCKREKASLIGCLLKGSPYRSGNLSDGNVCFENFTNLFKEFFIRMNNKDTPEFSMHLKAISESFNHTYYTIAEIMGVNLQRLNRLAEDIDIKKESILYELFRFSFYYFIKENYALINSPYKSYFNDFNLSDSTNSEMLETIKHNFSKAMEVDFKDILKDFDSKSAIIPDKIISDTRFSREFRNFIQTLKDNVYQGMRDNDNIMQFVSLLTSEIYNKEEMHNLGKIMSDEILSKILAEFAIDSDNCRIIDPCCGDGNLLISAYNKINELNKDIGHNSILKQIHGIEIDPNLVQLARFKLICSNLKSVDKDTFVYIQNIDLFDLEEKCNYDSLLMNPPFLRNEDINLDKNKILEKIEKVTGNISFIRMARQPNLYFYFVEKALSLLKNRGKGSIILMTKFLNNLDGIYLKEFLKPHLTSIIAYPPSFFEGFKVTTCIVVIDKNNKEDFVSFVNIKDTNVFKNIANLRELIKSSENSVSNSYSIIKVNKLELNPKENWRYYLIDPNNKFKNLENLNFFSPLHYYFRIIKRGKADNCGGSSLIYPFSKNNQLESKANKIEKRYIGYGLQRNKLTKGRRKVILTEDCLSIQKGIHFPSKYDEKSNSGIPEDFSDCKYLKDYCISMRDLNIKRGEINLMKVMNSAYSSIVAPKIIIPRGDRKKHIIYLYPFSETVLLSTNFFYLDGFENHNEEIPLELQLKFIVGFLNSSFGQIQFEMHSNDQEGMRKIEEFIIKKIKLPNIESLNVIEIKKVIIELEKLNSADIDFVGIEDSNPRRELDLAISEIIYKREKMGFSDPNALCDYFEYFLKEVVFERISK